MGQQPLDAPDPARSAPGSATVDEALSPLADLDRRPVEEHLPVLEQAHATLREALASARPPAPDRAE